MVTYPLRSGPVSIARPSKFQMPPGRPANASFGMTKLAAPARYSLTASSPAHALPVPRRIASVADGNPPPKVAKFTGDARLQSLSWPLSCNIPDCSIRAPERDRKLNPLTTTDAFLPG